MRAFALYLSIISVIAFALMGWDKYEAKHAGRRIPERTLLFSALLGGSLGAIGGMFFFRHKTRHWQFRFGLPAILIIQLALLFFLPRLR
ncbi:hypothetical protein SDC9_119011 [bioreactor metagenome]|uniref:DUF1294 domain-containing protein n=1 Tax=bioreactor metagenome TaxID=1076179 RepID=A0A645C3U0_9ZZZZ